MRLIPACSGAKKPGRQSISRLHSHTFTFTVWNESMKYSWIHLRIIKCTLVRGYPGATNKICFVNIARHRYKWWCAHYLRLLRDLFIFKLQATHMVVAAFQYHVWFPLWAWLFLKLGHIHRHPIIDRVKEFKLLIYAHTNTGMSPVNNNEVIEYIFKIKI